MEAPVWTSLFAQAAAFVSNLFASSRKPASLTSGGGLQNVQESDADSTLTSSNATILAVARTRRTADAIFGEIYVRQEFVCYSMERIAVAIPPGFYKGRLEYSPHFGRLTPHIDVPFRTYIEIHPLNFPWQTEGCVGVGTTIENDALNNSREAFEKLMAMLPSQFTVEVTEIL